MIKGAIVEAVLQ